MNYTMNNLAILRLVFYLIVVVSLSFSFLRSHCIDDAPTILLLQLPKGLLLSFCRLLPSRLAVTCTPTNDFPRKLSHSLLHTWIVGNIASAIHSGPRADQADIALRRKLAAELAAIQENARQMQLFAEDASKLLRELIK